jgi:hypothetical protein
VDLDGGIRGKFSAEPLQIVFNQTNNLGIGRSGTRQRLNNKMAGLLTGDRSRTDRIKRN